MDLVAIIFDLCMRVFDDTPEMLIFFNALSQVILALLLSVL